MENIKTEKRIRRKARIRHNIFGVEQKPRLSVFRSLGHIYAQLIDDENSKTLVAASDKELKEKGTKSQIAEKVGELISKKALSKKIDKVIFDRNGYKYHGRVKALADGARKGGLKF